MNDAMTNVPLPQNEPVRDYAPGSPERETLTQTLADMKHDRAEIPLLIGGEEVHTGDLKETVEPHAHGQILADCHQASEKEVLAAIDAGREALPAWSNLSFDDRAAIFLRAADLLAGPWRDRINAATMLGQSKTVFQAEVDAACEMIDFFRFNVAYAQQICSIQPNSAPGMHNQCEYRNLEGFVLAVTPFNFTSIAANLPTAPALMGNVVLWKPASTAVLSNWLMMDLLREAGMPPGVINFLPGPGPRIGDVALPHHELAGVHFTGSTSTFQTMWRVIGENIAGYRSYPRIVGETGGKDFVFVHPSGDPAALVTALVRGAFEYQGQKCSAASRAYIPQSMWDGVREQLVDTLATVTMGDVTDFSHLMGAVIDQASFDKCQRYIDQAKADPACTLLSGGECDDSSGWFVQPTVFETTDPKAPSMCEEIFGPILTIYVYDDANMEETLDLCDSTSPYGLTGAIFAQDKDAVDHLSKRLRHAAGNFYINDKPTGAVVGQQPFGGSRASGTNDKAGSLLNLIRWTSVRTIKEVFDPPTDYRYPHMGEE